MDIKSGTNVRTPAANPNEVSGGLCYACRKLFSSSDLTTPVGGSPLNRRRFPRNLIEGTTDDSPRPSSRISELGRMGCAICAIVRAHMLFESVGRPYFSLETLESMSRFRVTAWEPCSNWDSDADSDSDDSDWALVHQKVMVDRAGPEGIYDIMWTWINRCQESHDNCREVTSEGWLPSRLVDVTDLANPKLVRFQDIPEGKRDSPYTTLSHRWTDKVPLLTCLTFLQFQSGLPLSDMSRTFLDAFTITHFLGIKYIWVDSLCILQDSSEDWKVESSHMGRIYQRCFLNLSATIASEGDGMLFEGGPDPGSVSSVFEIPVNGNTQQALAKTTFRASAELWYRMYKVAKSPLNSRGWVFQERLLSPRTIHFLPGEFFWECRCAWSSQFKCHFVSEGGKQEECPWPRAKWSLGVQACTSAQYELDWDQLIQKYALCKFTRATDRLMALAGTARAVAEHRRTVGTSGRSDNQASVGNYLAGLWKEELPESLGWAIHWPNGFDGSQGQIFTVKRAEQYRAPSWSWTSLNFEYASVSSARQYERNMEPARTTRLAQVLSSGVVPQSGFDEFGPLVGGHITLVGRVYPVNLEIFRDMQVMTNPFERCRHHGGCTPCLAQPFGFLLDEWPETAELGLAADVFLPIFASEDILDSVKCLLLKRISHPGNESSQTYIRVGILCISLHEMWDSEEAFKTFKPKIGRIWTRVWTTEMISFASDTWGPVIALGRAALASSNPDELLDLSDVVTIY